MGGIIEDYIFRVLWGDKLTASQIRSKLEKMGAKRTKGNLNYHLKKMYDIEQLKREKDSSGDYVYWNDLMLGKQKPPIQNN